MPLASRRHRDLGDFQTPPELVAAILQRLGPIGQRWERVLEPTCGCGNFITGLLHQSPPPREIVGVEIQRSHVAAARKAVERTLQEGTSHVNGGCPPRVHIVEQDIFSMDLARDIRWRSRGPLLVVGNPPWITRAELGALRSSNVPPKGNPKGLLGLEAITGSANFDLAEAVWLKLLRELAVEQPTLALLCKTQVARNVLHHAWRNGIPLAEASIHRIDAAKWFKAAASACLLVVRIGALSTYARPQKAVGQAAVYSDLMNRRPEGMMGLAPGGQLVADLDAYARASFVDGPSPLEWRQGVKHDAAAVMELVRVNGKYRNGLGETVDVEPDWVYPLCKGRDLQAPDPTAAERAVIVTQRRLGDDPAALQHQAPRLWKYLCSHRARFRRRKSSIYKNRPDFVLFGVGPYAFAPYKVAVAGLYRTPRFRVLKPVAGKPVLLDDTCYFVPCETAAQAASLAGLLNSRPVHDLLQAVVFSDSKRPITKKLLQRIDVTALRRHLLSKAGEKSGVLEGEGI